MAQVVLIAVVLGIIVVAIIAGRIVIYGLQDRIREQREREIDRRRHRTELLKNLSTMTLTEAEDAMRRGDISMRDYSTYLAQQIRQRVTRNGPMT